MREMSRKIRVLNISESAHGGLATYFNLLSGYRSERVRHHFLIPDCHAFMLDAGVDRRTFRHSGRNPATIFRILRQFRVMVRTHAPDVLVFHSFFSIPALLCARIFYPSIPRIFIPHGWTTWQFRRSSPGRKLAELCERIACQAANCYICVSTAELSFAQSSEFPGTYKLIPHAVAARPPEERAARSAEGLQLLYVGRLDYQKGVDLLLKAFAEAVVVNPTLNLTIIGEAARTKRNLLPQFAALEALGIRTRGWLPRAEIDVYYAEADILIVPSRWEAFGLVVSEAARLGTPSIVSDRGGLPELIEDGVDGYIFHLSEEERIGPLTVLLSRLSAPDLWKMRENVWSRIERTRSAADMVAEFEDLLDPLVDGTRACG